MKGLEGRIAVAVDHPPEELFFNEGPVAVRQTQGAHGESNMEREGRGDSVARTWCQGEASGEEKCPSDVVRAGPGRFRFQLVSPLTGLQFHDLRCIFIVSWQCTIHR